MGGMMRGIALCVFGARETHDGWDGSYIMALISLLDGKPTAAFRKESFFFCSLFGAFYSEVALSFCFVKQGHALFRAHDLTALGLL